MRFAAIADVHGNHLALDAVLADIRAQGIDDIVHLGDMASGPLDARRTMDALMALDAVHVLGNHDRYLIDRPEVTTVLSGMTYPQQLAENLRIFDAAGAGCLSEAEKETLGDLALMYNSYENNLLMVNFEIESASVAEANLDAALEKYKIGSLSGIEFREFQRSYIDAVDRKLSAIYQAKVSELSLLLLSGDIRGSFVSE